MRKKLLATLCTLGTLCLAAGIGLSVQTNVAAASEAPTVTLKQGASARLHKTEYGIRFTGVIENYDEDYTYGMYIFPADYLNDYTTGSVVEHAQGKLGEGKTLAGGDCKVYMKGSAYQINGALTGLNYNNLNREFVAIAYVKDGEGNYSYSEVSASRNIVWVAGAALADETRTYDETQTEVLNDFIQLGYHQAVGTEEATAKEATTLPEITVGGTTEVYNYLYAAPTPEFTYGGAALENAFNPYANEVAEGLTYSQKNVRSFAVGDYEMKYANIAGAHTVTVRAFDETLDESYFGIYETVTKTEKTVFEDMQIECAPDAQFIITTKGQARGFIVGTDYTVTQDGVSIPLEMVDYFKQPADLVVYEGGKVTVYGVEAYYRFFTQYKGQTRTYIPQGNLVRDLQPDKIGLTLNANVNLTARYAMYGIDISYLKEAMAQGYSAVEFDVEVDAAFVGYANKGIRVYASTQTGNTLDGGAIQTGTAGVTLYKDFGTDVTSDTFTVTVMLKDFLALDANANQLRFIVSSASGSKVYIKDLRVRQATAEELAAAAAALLQTKYGFTQANSTRPVYNGIWDVPTTGQFGLGWDATEQAMKVNMIAGKTPEITGRYYVMCTDIAMLKDAYAAGFTTMTFKVRSADGAFADEGRGIRVYSKQNAGLDSAGIATNAGAGIYVYGDFGTDANTTEFTVRIDIAEFLNLNTNAKYMGIVLNMKAGTNAYFSDLNFFMAAE